MPKPEPDFTLDDLAAQIAAVLADTPSNREGFTAREIIAATGLSKKHVMRGLRILVEHGTIDDTGRKRVRRLGGTLARTVSYRLAADDQQQ